MIDFESDAITLPSSERLSDVQILAQKQQTLERKVEELKQELKTAESDLKQVAEIDLPEMMKEIGLREIVLEDGTRLKIEDRVFASIPVERKKAAFAWLRDHGHGALVKSNFVVPFGKGEDAEALAFETSLKGSGVKFKRDESVHTMTLRAFAREQLEHGVELPAELFSVYVQAHSVIKDS